MATIVTLAASPSTRSRTDAVLAHAVSRLADRGHVIEPVVLRDLSADALVRQRTDDPAVAAAVAAVAASDAVIVATPVYKAAYAGLLKVFLDLLGQSAFRGKDVLPLATGGTPANVLALDYALRPVLESLGAAHVSPGRVVLASLVDTDADGRRVLSDEARGVVDRVTDTFAERLEAQLAHRRRRAATRVVTIVGGGPRALGIVERIGANLLDDADDLEVHVVDPHPVGAGRIWRADQSRLLWMNSTAEDVTVFTDTSVTCEGPIVPGPSLAEWVAGPGRDRLAADGWPVETYGPTSFLPRGVQAAYLAWAWEQARRRLPDGVTLRVHREQAVDLADVADLPTPATGGGAGRRQRVTLASGVVVDSDVVILAQGHLDQQASPPVGHLAATAASRRLTYVPPGFTADLDLDGLRPGEPVVVRGMGLAFIDLMVLVGEGRGGRYSGEGLDLTYHPSGAEPVLHVGSTRGVPYHAKLGYAIGDGPAPLVHLTPERIDARAGGPGLVDVRTNLWPLIETELASAHYRRLFTAHPERTRGDLDELEAALVEHGSGSAPFAAAVRARVPDARDHFDLPRIDRPLAGRTYASPEQLQRAVAGHVETDLARRADPRYSADRAVFDTLVSVYGAMGSLLAGGRITTADRLRWVEGGFRGLFSFLASGPPPRRLAELLALHRAGLVRFLGPDLTVRVDDDAFVASSPSVPGEVRTRALVDAFLARVDIAETADPLLRALLDRGELHTEHVADPVDGTRLVGGLLTTDPRARALAADGSAHPRRILVGPSVSGSAGSAGFARPGFNGAAFRQNDQLARTLLADLGYSVAPPRNITHLDTTPRRGTGATRPKEHVA